MKKVFLFMMAMICALAVFAQKGDLNLNDPIKADPNVVIGKLDNGLTYYIRKNTYPKISARTPTRRIVWSSVSR